MHTRPHRDVDIIIQQKDLEVLFPFLEKQGYKNIFQPNTRSGNFVLEDSLGNLIDVHVIVLDPLGNGIYGPEKDGQLYESAALAGIGKINNYAESCISPA